MTTLTVRPTRRHAARLASRPGARPVRPHRHGRFGAGLLPEEPAALEAEGSDPAAWPAWTDAFTWEPNAAAGCDDLGMADPADADEEPIDPAEGFAAPEPDEGPTLSLDQWIDSTADRVRKLGTQAADLVADSIAELAELVRFTRATTPEAALDRIRTLEASRLADLFAARS